MYAGLAAIASTQVTIFVIAVVKYWSDFKAVLTGKGDIPYDKSLIDDLERVRISSLVK